MKNEILTHLENPGLLEKLYQENQSEFQNEFLRFNGDVIVISAILLLAGIIFTAITSGLFGAIGLWWSVWEIISGYIVVYGLVASPIVGTWLTQTIPQLANKISPVIAAIFTPLVLVMLVIFLFAMTFTNVNPYEYRDFLLILNSMLIGVMAIILFSVSETSPTNQKMFRPVILFSLSIVTLLVNGVALSAILYRLFEWGISPNRVAVLGENVLIMFNLILTAWQLFRTIFRFTNLESVGKTIAAYLPIYIVWTIIVVFLFPFFFNFR